jgi:hypothetical protein
MTDTDNTGSTAKAYYGDIVFRKPSDGQEGLDTQSGE